jgi:hypothetical protein
LARRGRRRCELELESKPAPGRNETRRALALIGLRPTWKSRKRIAPVTRMHPDFGRSAQALRSAIAGPTIAVRHPSLGRSTTAGSGQGGRDRRRGCTKPISAAGDFSESASLSIARRCRRDRIGVHHQEDRSHTASDTRSRSGSLQAPRHSALRHQSTASARHHHP